MLIRKLAKLCAAAAYTGEPAVPAIPSPCPSAVRSASWPRSGGRRWGTGGATDRITKTDGVVRAEYLRRMFDGKEKHCYRLILSKHPNRGMQENCETACL